MSKQKKGRVAAKIAAAALAAGMITIGLSGCDKVSLSPSANSIDNDETKGTTTTTSITTMAESSAPADEPAKSPEEISDFELGYLKRYSFPESAIKSDSTSNTELEYVLDGGFLDEKAQSVIILWEARDKSIEDVLSTNKDFYMQNLKVDGKPVKEIRGMDNGDGKMCLLVAVNEDGYANTYFLNYDLTTQKGRDFLYKTYEYLNSDEVLYTDEAQTKPAITKATFKEMGITSSSGLDIEKFKTDYGLEHLSFNFQYQLYKDGWIELTADEILKHFDRRHPGLVIAAGANMVNTPSFKLPLF
ncbi:MAG: hypothetical protein LBM38_03185 [Clostridiales bacterium]|jgi:hypothetical protein|nr:hypothetical protein [Clostridiales bacterium]